jgi:hypothetical protein
VVNEAKSFVVKLGFELGDLVGTFSKQVAKGALYRHKDSIQLVAKSIDENFDNPKSFEVPKSSCTDLTDYN